MTNRREFIQSAAAAALLAALHPCCGFASAPGRKPASGKTLIHKIGLQTAVPLAEMKAYYQGLLGFSLVSETAAEIVFRAGNSVFQFSNSDMTGKAPFYHFAFNIPENQVLQAREWLLEKTPLVPTPNHLKDPRLPDDVRHFSGWNAHSLFFFDPAFNVVEFIARHDLDNATRTPFSINSLINISEIGFIVEQQQKTAGWVIEQTGLRGYPLSVRDPWAVGDENGLLLCLPKGNVFGENTQTPVRWDVFPTYAEIRSAEDAGFSFDGMPYKIKQLKI